MKEAVSCGGVVIFRGKILLLYKNYKDRYKGWVFPKGTVEQDETYEETALREVREETGAKGTIVKYLGSSEYEFAVSHKEDRYYTGASTRAFIRATNVIISVADIDFGDNVTVNVILKDMDGNMLNGTVNVTINSTCSFTVDVVNGVGSAGNISGLAEGRYNATAVFAGNETYLGSLNSTLFKVRPVVNITVVKTANVTNVSVGDMVNFTITVTNTGLSNATNICVVDSLPYSLHYIESGSNTTHQGTRTIANACEIITWNISGLAPMQSVTLWVKVLTTANGTFSNTAVANSTEVSQNSSGVCNITVRPAVNLTVVKTANVTNVSVGGLVNFTITVTNHGPSNATGVIITDELDSAFEFVKANENIKPVNGKLVWNITKILNGTSVSVWLVVKVLSNGTFTTSHR